MTIEFEGKPALKVNISDQAIVNALSKNGPFSGECGRVDDEVFLLIESDRKLSDTARDVFHIGDVIYWVKSDGSKQAIAVFFGNTHFGDGTKPRPASASDKIGTVDLSGFDTKTVTVGTRCKVTFVDGES